MQVERNCRNEINEEPTNKSNESDKNQSAELGCLDLSLLKNTQKKPMMPFVDSQLKQSLYN